MIEVTRESGTPMYLNADHIEYVEATPDTVIMMDSGKSYKVKEDALTVVERIVAYQQRVRYVATVDGNQIESAGKVTLISPSQASGEEVETTSEMGNLPD
ncbi:flagellar FlbD family protein [bacterium]|nr:flagellar FlbD family protein [bacterium]